MNTTSNLIFDRIQTKGRGTVFTNKDFHDLGTNAAVGQTLSRLARRGTIRRLNHGLYDYPRENPRFGILSPNLDAVAMAVSNKNGNRLLVSGAYAANALGLSNQVPAQIVYFTDGSDKRVRVGRQTIEFRHASPRRMAGAGKISGVVIQALRYFGKDNVGDDIVHQLQRTLTDDDRRILRQDISIAPDWLRPILTQITENTDGPRRNLE